MSKSEGTAACPSLTQLSHNMATIPVEKKEGAPWWLWLLGALLLGLLIWFFFLRDNDEEVVDNTEQVAPMPVATGLNLSDVWVTRLAGANAFYVSPDSAGTDETLVVLDGTEAPATLAPGQHVSLTGTLEPVGTTDLASMGVLAADAAAMTPESEYVRVSALTVLNGDMAADEMMGDEVMADDAVPAPGMDGDNVAEVIRTTDALYVANLTPMVGRRVEVDNATVTSVVGDSTFYVGTGSQKVLVALSNLGESQTGPGDGSDGRFNINVGDKVNLRGTVTRFDAANSVFRSLSAADRASETTRGAFVNVTRIADITKR